MARTDISPLSPPSAPQAPRDPILSVLDSILAKESAERAAIRAEISGLGTWATADLIFDLRRQVRGLKVNVASLRADSNEAGQ